MSVYLDRVPGCFFFVGSASRPHRPPFAVFDIDERARGRHGRLRSRGAGSSERL
jgi:hypothetical protein